MSCITEILKLKDKFLLDVEGKKHLLAEGGGTYKGYEYLVTFTDMGHRCGYVALPSGHKLEKNSMYRYDSDAKEDTIKIDIKVNDDSIDNIIDCHGGVTFFSNDNGLKSLLKNSCTDMWIVFDCVHSYDLRNREAFVY